MCVRFYVLNHSKYRFPFNVVYIGIMNRIRKPTFHAARYNRQKYLGSDVRSRPLQSAPRQKLRLSRPEKGLQKRVNLMQQTTNSDLSRHYLPRQLRHLILQEYLSGVKTARQLSEEHGIPMSTIHKLGQRWKAKNSCSFVSTPNPFPIMSRVTRKKPVNCYPRTKPFGGTWKRLYYVWKAMRSWEISSRKIRCRPAKKSAAGQSGASKKDTQE